IVNSFPPIRLTSTASDSASARPSSSSGCAINFSTTSLARAGPGASTVAVAQQRAQIIKMNPDQARPREQTPDAAHTFNEQSVRDAERVEHAGVLVHQLEGLLARQADDAVGDGFELVE